MYKESDTADKNVAAVITCDASVGVSAIVQDIKKKLGYLK